MAKEPTSEFKNESLYAKDYGSYIVIEKPDEPQSRVYKHRIDILENGRFRTIYRQYKANLLKDTRKVLGDMLLKGDNKM